MQLTKIIKKFISVFSISGVLILFGCSNLDNLSAPIFESNKRLLVIGQDNDSINDYYNKVSKTHIGVSLYTNMMLVGLSSDHHNGQGNNNIELIAEKYPHSPIVIGFSLAEDFDNTYKGKWDKNIEIFLRKLITLDRAIYLRLGYEFDGPWNKYDPEKFKAIWSKFNKKIVELGGKNKIAMVWHAASQCHFGKIRTYKNLPTTDWYPGDEQVDYMAVSYFTPHSVLGSGLRGGTCNVHNEAINKVASFSKERKKKLMIAESCPQGYSIKNLTWSHRYGTSFNLYHPSNTEEILLWFKNYFDWIRENDVRIIVYINTDWDSQKMYTEPMTFDYWGSSRIQDNPEIKKRWIEHISSEEWER